MGNKRSKKDKVLSYLKSGRSITQRDAINLFNAYRLADIVFRLNKEGYNIINTKQSGFAIYKIAEPSGSTIGLEL